MKALWVSLSNDFCQSLEKYHRHLYFSIGNCHLFVCGVHVTHLFCALCCLIMCLNVLSSCPLRFRIKTMFGSSLPPVICRWAHVVCVFVCRNESGRLGALKSDSTHHFFRNACTKSWSLRFSQFSGC